MAAAQGCGNKTWTTRVIAFGVVILGIFRSIALSRRRFGGNVFALVIGFCPGNRMEWAGPASTPSPGHRRPSLNPPRRRAIRLIRCLFHRAACSVRLAPRAGQQHRLPCLLLRGIVAGSARNAPRLYGFVVTPGASSILDVAGMPGQRRDVNVHVGEQW
jgi:hypothetical protein